MDPDRSSTTIAVCSIRVSVTADSGASNCKHDRDLVICLECDDIDVEVRDYMHGVLRLLYGLSTKWTPQIP